MSSRALRKAQREREEQERLQEVQRDEEEDEAPAATPKRSVFAMLGDEDDGDAEEGDEEELDPEACEALKPASVPKSSGKSKKKKKKKAKATGTPEPAGEELDEIDLALKSLSTHGQAAQDGTTAAGVDAVVNETNSLLAIDTSQLHAEKEMRRLFGRAALEQQDDEPPPPNQNMHGNRRQQRRMQQVGLAQALRGQAGRDGRANGLSAMALRRNIFIQGKEEWPAATSGGLGMEVEEKRADGTTLYRFVHNTAYRDVQSQFESCVESMDPDRMVVLLQHNPYHISTLLQVSEIAKQERDHSTSGDLLERALFSMGRAVHSTFPKAVAEGRARLDFRREENRELWLAAWRYMQNLSMRGTWRTVYEWAKLLLALSPQEDPYGLWLVLDQYALRARQDLDYLNISRNSTFQAVHTNAPNVQLSQALAEHRAGNKSKGKQALFTAVGRYPWVVARLMQELNIDPLPPAVWGKAARTDKEKLEAELYATRVKDVWNTPETTALLTEVASAVLDGTPAAPVNDSKIGLSHARHVLLSDTPALIALVPRKYTSRPGTSSDPLPPGDGFPSYIPSRVQGDVVSLNANTVREAQSLRRFFAELFAGPSTAEPSELAHLDDLLGPEDEAGFEDEALAQPERQAHDPSQVNALMDLDELDPHAVRRMVDAGLDPIQVIRANVRRLQEIQAELVADLDAQPPSAPMPRDGDGAVPVLEDDEAGGRRARVEDAPEND